jgi:hypothetical protein
VVGKNTPKHKLEDLVKWQQIRGTDLSRSSVKCVKAAKPRCVLWQRRHPVLPLLQLSITSSASQTASSHVDVIIPAAPVLSHSFHPWMS